MSNKKKSIILIFIIPFLMGLGVDLYVPALPQISLYFNASHKVVEWSVGIYMLGYGIGQIILGPISDWRGRKKVILFSSIMFLIVSILTSFSPSISIFNILRLLQGISIAGLAVVVRAIMVDVFSGVELRKVSNYFTLSWSLGPIIGPFIGAVLSGTFGWKFNFYLFSIYGLIIFIYTFFFFDETNLKLESIDIKVLFKKSSKMIRCRKFIFIIITSAICYSLIIVFNIVGPFIIESFMHESMKFYGNIAMVLGTAYFIGTTINRFLINKFREKTLIIGGVLGSLLICILMIIVNIFVENIFNIIVPVYFIFLSIGFIVPNSVSIAMNIFKDNGGLASSLFGVITGGVVFIVSNVLGFINIRTGFSLGLVYLILVIICITTSYISFFRKKVHD